MSDIPKGWRSGRVRDFFSLKRGFDLTANAAVDGPYQVISSSGPSYSHNDFKIEPPGVVTGRKGKLGKVFFTNEPFWPHDTTLWVDDFMGNSHQYIWRFLQGLNLERYDEASSVPTLNRNNVFRLKCVVPPLPEQKKLAEILSTCDEVIEKTGALIEAKKQQKKALMQQLLTGQKRLPGFEGEWEDAEIGKLMKVVSRPVDWDDEELYRLVSVRRRSGGLFFREALHGRDIKTKVMNTTEKNDFLISKMQVVHGAMAMTPAEFDGGHVSGSYITLVAREKWPIHMPFFDFLSRTKWLYHLTFVSSYGVVIEKMTFNLRDFLKKEIRIPATLEEQEAITAVLETAGNEIASLEKKQAILKQQKKALMQKLLTGQIRVNV